jgi:hypothetical protein
MFVNVAMSERSAFVRSAAVFAAWLMAWTVAPRAEARQSPTTPPTAPAAAPAATEPSAPATTPPTAPATAPTTPSGPAAEPGPWVPPPPANGQVAAEAGGDTAEQLKRELEALRAEVEELKKAVRARPPAEVKPRPRPRTLAPWQPVPPSVRPPGARPAPLRVPGRTPDDTPGPGPAEPQPPPRVLVSGSAPPAVPFAAAVPSQYAAPPSARGPFPCLTRRCKERYGGPFVPALSAQVGNAILSMNLYADFGYALGPQRKHKYYDYITKQEVEDTGRRDYTSYPLYVNQFSLAYAFVQGQYEIPNLIRFRFALHAGHIVESLYNEEPKSLQLVREASVYFFPHRKVAIEGGILPSYYGAEIVLNKENLHATRAYIADFTPDYEAGVRLHYHVRKDMALRFMVLNGWQEIRDANGRKGFGFVWSVYRPYKIVGDWTMYWGNEAPAGETQAVFRHYQNLYYRIWLGKRWLIFPMFDFVMQSAAAGRYNFVVAPAFSVRFGITDKVGVALRYDYLWNKNDIIPELKTGTPNGWQSHSGTATLEYLPLPQLTLRLEGRYGANKDAVFRDRNNLKVHEDWYAFAGAAFHF